MNRLLLPYDFISCYPPCPSSFCTCHRGLFNVLPHCQEYSCLRTSVCTCSSGLYYPPDNHMLSSHTSTMFFFSSSILSNAIRIVLNIKLHTQTHPWYFTFLFPIYLFMVCPYPLEHKLHKSSIYLAVVYPNIFPLPGIVWYIV